MSLQRFVGQHYIETLAAFHAKRKPTWYLEIGTQTGKSLALSKARSIAIDPKFVLDIDVIGSKPELHLFQETSDDFFAGGHLTRLGAQLDMAFLDGMHRYEFLLRDFINTERHMRPSGLILLHDCVPWSRGMTVRDQALSPTREWTGDVWKVVPILQKYRPDLKIEVLDCAPTGLVAISKVDPKSRVLEQRYDAILAEFDNFDELESTVGGFKIVSAEGGAPTSFKSRRAKSLSFAVQLPVPRPRGQSTWGDYHFGVGLATALARLGHSARVQTKKNWMAVQEPGEIDIVLRGLAPYQRRHGHPLIYWLISQTGEDFLPELDAADFVFVAGAPVADRLKKALGNGRVETLPQAFDPDRMFAPTAESARAGRLFVGISRKFVRPMVDYALRAELPIELWGSGWNRGATKAWFRGERIENEDLGNHYRKAAVVLNDHTPTMRGAGFCSNRIFDALACAAPVISDAVAWIPEDLAPWVYTVDSPEAFRDAVAAAEAEGADRRAARLSFAKDMTAAHSFDARAEAIVAKAREIIA